MTKKVFLIGCGFGGKNGLTVQAQKALRGCGCIFGNKELTEPFGSETCAKVEQTKAQTVLDYLSEHSDIKKAAVMFSGSLCREKELIPLKEALSADYETEIVPGVDVISWFCGKLGCCFENAAVLSAAEAAEKLPGAVRTNKLTFVAGSELNAQQIFAALCSHGLSGLSAAAGENFGTEKEKIRRGTTAELSQQKFENVQAVCVQNPEFVSGKLRVCIPDEEFEHNGVSITRSEVRAVSVGKLKLAENSIVYDIGCGTGSVSVECALQARSGMVYAVDKNKTALRLTAENREKFSALNIKPVEGEAPAVLKGLPAPDCVFIGGSSGNLPQITEAVLKKNPCARIVLNAISLETVIQAVQCMERFKISDLDIAQLSVAKSRPSGGHRLMQAQNPVYIISGQGSDEK